MLFHPLVGETGSSATVSALTPTIQQVQEQQQQQQPRGSPRHPMSPRALAARIRGRSSSPTPPLGSKVASIVQHIDSSSNKSSPAASGKEVGPRAVKLTPEDLQKQAVHSKLRRVGSNVFAADSEGSSTRQAASLGTAEEGEGIGGPSAAGPVEVSAAGGAAAVDPRSASRTSAFAAGAAAAVGAAAAAAAGLFPGVKAAVAGSQPVVGTLPPPGPVGPSMPSSSTSAVQSWLDENVATPKLNEESFPPSPLVHSGRQQEQEQLELSRQQQEQQTQSNKSRWKKPWSFGGAGYLKSGQTTPRAQFSDQQETPFGAGPQQQQQGLQSVESAGAAPAVGVERPRRLLDGAGSLHDGQRRTSEGGVMAGGAAAAAAAATVAAAAGGDAGGTPAQKLKAAARRQQSADGDGIGPRRRGSAAAAAPAAAAGGASPRTQRRVCTYNWWMIIALVGLIMVVVGVLVGVVAPRTMARSRAAAATEEVGSMWFTSTAKISAPAGNVAWRCEDILGSEQVGRLMWVTKP